MNNPITLNPSLALLLKQNKMNKTGPIVIIEDDHDDKVFLQEVFQKLKYQNELIFFYDGEDALEYLNKTDIMPFLILSDVNLPKVSGFDLRKRIHTNAKLHIKCIPYLFFTTAATQQSVIDAYSLSVQGFFTKQNSLDELEKTIFSIMEYWKRCSAPNDFV